jgi:hypothetical protein
MFSMVKKNRAGRKEGPPGVNDKKGRKVQQSSDSEGEIVKGGKKAEKRGKRGDIGKRAVHFEKQVDISGGRKDCESAAVSRWALGLWIPIKYRLGI